MKYTEVFFKNAKARSRLVVNQGGTSSSKTWSILTLFATYATKKSGLLFSVVAESLPHIKRGAERDFKTILDEGKFDYEENKTDHIFTIPSVGGGSSQIEFFGADDPGKVHGSRRDFLFINECNNVKWNVADQLEIRTRLRAFYDYNPTESFWIHNQILTRQDVTYIQSTYKDNTSLNEGIVRAIEARVPVYLIGGVEVQDWTGQYYKDKTATLIKNNAEWWNVYALGNTGTIEGRIYKHFDLVDEMPKDVSVSYGMDFGFTNDPTAMVAVAIVGDDLYVDELIYDRGLTNSDICNRLREIGLTMDDTIVCDSADPKTINELQINHFNAQPAQKGADSVRHGIDTVNRYRIKVTKRSVNFHKEIRGYVYKTAKTGETINQPADGLDDHLLDAMRYVVQSVTSPSSGALISIDWPFT